MDDQTFTHDIEDINAGHHSLPQTEYEVEQWPYKKRGCSCTTILLGILVLFIFSGSVFLGYVYGQDKVTENNVTRPRPEEGTNVESNIVPELEAPNAGIVVDDHDGKESQTSEDGSSSDDEDSPPSPKPTFAPLPPTPQPSTKPTFAPPVPPTPQPSPKPTVAPPVPPTPLPSTKPSFAPPVPPTPLPSFTQTFAPKILSPRPSTRSPTRINIATSAPTVHSSRYAHILNIISRISSSSSLDRRNSPQFKALEWIVFDDARQELESDSEIIQRYALVTIYYSTSGGSWKESSKWLSTEDECNWQGIVCSDTIFKIISEIKLSQNNLSGAIPPEISALTKLTNIELWLNAIGGSIPSNINNISSLKTIYLDNNRITGTIPDTIGDLSSLEDLTLYRNALTGTIPETVTNLKSVWRLWLSDNDLSGTITPSIGSMTSLKALYLESNRLTGVLPDTLKDLPLTDVRLSFNKLRGTLPNAMAKLQNLKVLYLDNNMITGSVPETWMTGMKSLVDLQLSKNELNGVVPEEITFATHLQVFDVAMNQIGGRIPAEIGGMTLEVLKLHGNVFDGIIPNDLAKVETLTKVTLEDNHFIGSVPEGLCHLSKITVLSADCGGDAPSVTCTCCTSCP